MRDRSFQRKHEPPKDSSNQPTRKVASNKKRYRARKASKVLIRKESLAKERALVFRKN